MESEYIISWRNCLKNFNKKKKTVGNEAVLRNLRKNYFQIFSKARDKPTTIARLKTNLFACAFLNSLG